MNKAASSAVGDLDSPEKLMEQMADTEKTPTFTCSKNSEPTYITEGK